MTESSTTGLFERLDPLWPTLVANCPRLALTGRDCSLDLRLVNESAERYFRIVNGDLESIKSGPRAMHRSDISLEAEQFAWQSFWSPVPPPGFHDVFAMSSYGHMTITGDIDLLLRHLGFIKQFLVLPRDNA